MKPAYAPDNTRSSVVVVFALAIAVTLIALLIGLSDKPSVEAIAIAAEASEPVGRAAAPQDSFGFETEPTTEGELFPTPAPDDPSAASIAIDPDPVTGATTEPAATPEVAAAVQPTPVPEAGAEASDDAFRSAPRVPTSAGTVEGTFFTRPEEDEGAIVAKNLVTVSFAPDGSGSFQALLNISYEDGTEIALDMSGPLVWTTTTPQVKATLTGTYTLDAPVAADDVSSTTAELSITSLESGSGSLCTPKCFGFTFPPQTGL